MPVRTRHDIKPINDLRHCRYQVIPKGNGTARKSTTGNKFLNIKDTKIFRVWAEAKVCLCQLTTFIEPVKGDIQHPVGEAPFVIEPAQQFNQLS